MKAIQSSVTAAIDYLAHSRLTDAEFIYTPSQISLASLRLSNPSLIDSFLEWRYSTASEDEAPPYGLPRDRLLSIISDLEKLIQQGSAGLDLKKIKGIDKRLKSCTNPEKVPGTALYIKRKQEIEAAAAADRAQKAAKVQQTLSDMDMVFGDIIHPKITNEKARPMSPRVSLGVDREIISSEPAVIQQDRQAHQDQAT